MDDRCSKAYASLPERLYVVQDGRVVYQVALVIMMILMLKLLVQMTTVMITKITMKIMHQS